MRFLTATALSLSLALGAAPAFAAGADKTGQTQSSATGQTTQSQGQKQVRAEQVIGSEIYSAKGERVGEIEDLVIGEKDKVTYAIVDVGGFLGMGEHQVALPFDELAARDDSSLMMSESMDKEELRQMEEFHRSEAYEDMPGGDVVNWPQGQAKVTR